MQWRALLWLPGWCIIWIHEFIYRRSCPLKEAYLDNSSTTRVCEPAAAKVMELMTENYGNPSSLHTLGFRAEQALTEARRNIAAALGAKEDEVFFTSGGTESNNLAIFGAAYARKRMGMHIVTTQIEHPSVTNAVRQLEKEGWEVTWLQPDREGHILPEAVQEAVRPDTTLVTMMAVNNEVGTILPLDAAAQAIAAKKAPALLHVDAVQGFGKLDLRPERRKIDLLSISAHKIHGPKGVGALYVRKGVRIAPRTFGGGQEHGTRPGTEGLPAIGGFGAAVKALPPVNEGLRQAEELAAICREKLLALPGVEFNSPEDALPYIVNFSVGAVRAETMLHFLAARGVYVSSGSACSKGKQSPVLEAMQLPKERIQAALRVSFSHLNTLEDVDALVEGVREGLASLAVKK